MGVDAVWRGRLLFAAPDLVVAALAGFAVGPMFLLVIGHFSAAVGVPVGVLGAAAGCWLAGLPDTRPRRRDTVLTVLALLFALVWLAYNLRYTAEDVYATRDPATYTITGQWLVHHGSLQIHTMPEVFGNPPSGQAASGSYAQVGEGLVNGQGDHLLSVFLGMAGSLFGTKALLSTNVVLAALGLLGFFALARRIVGPVLGLVAMLALGLSMPYIYVGRDAYTEPLTMAFLMGALLFAHRGWLSRRPADWAVCGLAAGAATAVRVDSYLALTAVVATITVYVGVAAVGQRRTALHGAGALAAGAAAPLTFGYLDLTHAARQYFDSQHGNITHLTLLLLASALASPLCVWLMWSTRVRSWLASDAFARRVPQVVAVVAAVVFVVLVTRPSWQTTHGPCRPDLANMQRTSQVAQDCTRTYDEQTLHWQGLYFGWPTIVLAFGGYAVLVADLVRRRKYQLVGTLAMGVVVSALYLWTAQASPDQPWAMRRYIPVIVPLYLVASAAALRALWHRRGAGALVLRPVVVGLAVFSVAFPYVTARPMRHVREEYGQLRQLNAICKAVGKNGAVIETDDATVFGYGQAVRSFCRVPAIGLVGVSADDITTAAAAVRAHGRVPFVLGQCDVVQPVVAPCVAPGAPGTKTSAAALSVVRVPRWPTQINKAPDTDDLNPHDHIQQYSVWLSVIDESGHAVPVTPGR